MEPYSTPPGYEPLPDALSGERATDHERQLLKDAGCNLDNMPPLRRGVAVRALRAGHEAGRRSVLQAPVRVWREGDPPPESAVTTIDNQCMVGVWDPETSEDWVPHVATYGPLIEVTDDFTAALVADAARRAALEDGAL